MLYFAILGAAVLAVLVVLIWGIVQFAFGNHNPSRSNRIMRMRVAFQAVAILLILGALVLGVFD